MKQTEEQIQRVALKDIHITGENARQKFELADLIASIEAQGVLQPIIVRKNGKGYKLVAGERRYRACQEIAKKGKVSEAAATIPAIVREMDDNQAFEVMIVENLQRENLTPLEEAKALAIHIEKFGDARTPDLADKIGKTAHWVRRRVAVLDLPKEILKAWNEGQLAFAHLEQLLRVKDNPEMMKRVWYLIADQQYTAKQIEKWIADNSTNLKSAKFDTKDCETCPTNSQKQFDLFGLGDSNAKCLKVACFREKLQNHLIVSWNKDTAGVNKKKYGTNHPILEGNGIEYEEFHRFKPDTKCKACGKFVTVFTLTGTVAKKEACIDRKCLYNRNYEAEKKQLEKMKKAKKVKDARDSGQKDAPRCDWHGKLYREIFYKERLPQAVAPVDPNDLKVAHMTLFAICKGHHEARKAFQRHFNEDEFNYATADEEIFTKIAELDLEKTREVIKAVSLAVVMYWDERASFNTTVRDAVARHFDVLVDRDYAPTRDYFKAKTRPEILRYLEKLPADKLKAITDLMMKRNPKDKLENKKREELIQLIFDSKADLTGCTPPEIANYVKDATVPNKNRPEYKDTAARLAEMDEEQDRMERMMAAKEERDAERDELEEIAAEEEQAA